MPSSSNTTVSESRVREIFDLSIEQTRAAAQTLTPQIAQAADLVIGALEQGGRVLACGNGGSTSDAQHFSCEMLGRFVRERDPLSAIALTADTSTLTAVGNDYGIDFIFSRQVTALGRPGDVLLAISTSGNSPNVLEAVKAAHTRGMRCVTLNGRDGGALTKLLNADDIDIVVAGNSTPRIQEVHGIIIHAICDLIDCHLLGEP